MQFKYTVIAGLIATALSGCGGGSNNETSTPTGTNKAPTVTAAAQTAKSGADVTIKATAADSDGTVATYSWAQKSGPTGLTLTNANADTVSFKAPVVTSDTDIVLTITVTDNQGAKTSADVKVTVQANQLPVISTSDSSAVGNTAVTLIATASDADGSIAAYQWVRTSGPDVVLTGANTATVSFTAPVSNTAQTLVLTLTVTDNLGGQTSKAISVLISPTTQAAVTGQVVKGVLANAALKVFKYVDNQPVELTAQDVSGSLSTDSTGNYNFNVLNYSGPLKITALAAADGNTSMRCDAVAGCKKTNQQVAAFGEEVKLTELDPALQLNTITSATAGGTVAGNISTLTHLAAELISKKALFSPEELAKSKSMVMNSFGLEGDMDQLVATPMDDTAAVAAVTDAKQLKYALINAAIANALLNSTAKAGEVATLSSRLNAAATDFANNDGALRVQRDDDAGFELALDEVLQAASQTSQQVQQRLEDANIDNANLVDDLANLATGFGHELDVRKENAGDDGRVVIVPTQPTNGDAMAKAVAMVKDVRVFANLIEGKGRNGEDFYGKVNDFDKLTIAATEMVELEADKFVLLAELAEIVSVLNHRLKNGELTGTEFELSKITNIPNLTGTIIYKPDDYQFQITANTADEKVALAVSLIASKDLQSYSLQLQGELTSKAASLKLAQGSQLEVSLAKPYDIDTAEFGVEPEVNKGTLSLQAELTQLASGTVINPMSFNGKIEGSLKMITVPTYEKTNRAGAFDGNEFFDEQQLIPTSLVLSGALKNQQQDEVSVVLTANIKNIETFAATGLQYYGKTLPNGLQLALSDDLNTLTISSPGLTGQRVISYQAGASDGQYLFQSKGSYWNGETEDKSNSLIQVTKDEINSVTTYTVLAGYEINESATSQEWIRIYPVVENSATKYYFRKYTGGYSTTLPYQPLDAQGNSVVFENVAGAASNNFDTFEQAMQAAGVVVDPRLPSSNLVSMLSKSYGHAFIENDVQTKELGAAVLQFFEVDFNQLKLDKTLNVKGYLVSPLLAEKATLSTNTELTQAKLSFFDQKIVSTLQQTDSDQMQSYKVDRFEQGRLRDSTVFNVHKLQGSGGVDLACERFPQGWNSNVMTFVRETMENNIKYLQYRTLYSGVTLLDNGRFKQSDGTERNINESNFFAGKTRYSSNRLVEYCGTDPNGTAGLALAGTLTVPAATYHGQYGVLRFSPEVQGVGYVSVTNFYQDLTAAMDKQLDIVYYRPSPNPSNNLEAGDNYLQVDAALTVQAKIAGYSLSATLEASRTAIDDAKLGLNVVYKLPDDSAQRSFKVTGATDSNLVELSNNEGVTVSLDRSIKSGNSQVTLGEIKVGGVEMAKIINRSGVVLIKYSNNNIESL